MRLIGFDLLRKSSILLGRIANVPGGCGAKPGRRIGPRIDDRRCDMHVGAQLGLSVILFTRQKYGHGFVHSDRK